MVMDKAAIRGKAKTMAVEIDEMSNEYFLAKSMDYSAPIVYPVKRLEREVEAALTAAHDAGWNERGEADEQAVDELPHQQYYTLVHKAIRRLRKGKP